MSKSSAIIVSAYPKTANPSPVGAVRKNFSLAISTRYLRLTFTLSLSANKFADFRTGKREVARILLRYLFWIVGRDFIQ